MINTLSKIGIEGNFPNMIKGINLKLTGTITVYSKRHKTLPLRSGKKQGCLLSSLPVILY